VASRVITRAKGVKGGRARDKGPMGESLVTNILPSIAVLG
jgi:hypothetical protein